MNFAIIVEPEGEEPFASDADTLASANDHDESVTNALSALRATGSPQTFGGGAAPYVTIKIGKP